MKKFMTQEKGRRGSIGTIDELLKRKRGEEKEGEEGEKRAFEKSRKIERSPPKGGGKELENLIRELKIELKEIKEQGKRTEDTVRQEVGRMR
ncbi:hypothetical protein ALC62_00794 [Cyphomyrmex costatus]|uniref:Uncharacterized protein n=1 Tax=Cyphomyrmex costatus TaxID=456900 RepID=A0A151IPY9_9HYME|nr:hypothetical protein ALC62_00794 [Cyphomyrmex costatus]